MASNVSRKDSSSSSSDVSSEFENGGIEFNSLTKRLQDPSSSITKAVQGIASNNPLFKGIDVTDGINNTEAKTLSGRVQEAQVQGRGNLDNDPLKLSQDEFLKAFGLNGQQRPEEVGEAAKNDNMPGEAPAGEAAGAAPAASAPAGGQEAGGKASKDWNGDGKIDQADMEIEEKLKKIAEKSGKSIDEVAQEIGGENGKIDEPGELDKLDKMAKSAESGGPGDSANSESNGLNDLIQSFGGNDGADGANSLFSEAA